MTMSSKILYVDTTQPVGLQPTSSNRSGINLICSPGRPPSTQSSNTFPPTLTQTPSSQCPRGERTHNLPNYIIWAVAFGAQRCYRGGFFVFFVEGGLSPTTLSTHGVTGLLITGPPSVAQGSCVVLSEVSRVRIYP